MGLDKKLNNLVKRKNFQNFIVDEGSNMNYGLTNEQVNNMINVIENEEINERLIVLKNQINFLNDDKPIIDNSTLEKEEAIKIEKDIAKINDSLDTLNFKKESLNVSLNEYLNAMNISGAVRVKSQLSEINKQVDDFEIKKAELNNKINSSKLDYETQMLKMRELYDGVDIFNEGFNDVNYAKHVVYDYKKERALKLVDQFLCSLTPEKKEQILSEDENLKGLVDVGENI